MAKLTLANIHNKQMLSAEYTQLKQGMSKKHLYRWQNVETFYI